MKGICEVRYVGRSVEPPLGMPLSQHLHVCAHLEAPQHRTLGIFMDTSSCMING